MTTADPTRSPEGTESLWAYTHVAQRVLGDAGGNLTASWDTDEAERFADRMQDRIEQRAPGFSERILARRILTRMTWSVATRVWSAAPSTAGLRRLTSS
jgi:phytoene dehydrogenase-like protein